MLGIRKQNDVAAVRAVLEGDREAFAVLVTRYERAVKGVALASSRNFHEAEDIAQEAFLRAYRDLRSLRQPERFAPWIAQIARNLAMDHARRAARQPGVLPERETAPTPADRELHEILRNEVMLLPDAFREALVLHHFSGKTAAEIAQLLGISRDAAHKRIQRGRAELGASMEKHLHEALADQREKSSMAGAVMVAIAGISIAGKSGASPVVAVSGAATGWAAGKLAAIFLIFLLGGLAAWWAGRDQLKTLKAELSEVSATPQTPAQAPAQPERPHRSSGPTTASVGSPPVQEAATMTPAKGEMPPEEPSIEGRVADMHGSPIEGATIVGYSTDGFHAEATTNAEGKYLMEWLGEREYTLRARASGFYPKTEVVLAPARADFQLEGGPLLTCRLLDARSRLPVAGAVLRMRSTESISNASGHADLSPPAAAYVAFEGETVDIEADGYRNEHVPAQDLFSKDGGRVDLFLEPLSIVRGRVTNPAGAPISKVEVYALEPDFDRVARTDDEGRFEVLHLEAWPSTLYFSRFPVYRFNTKEGGNAKLLRESAALGMASLELPPNPPARVLERNVVMKGGASLSGRVSIDGRPFEEVKPDRPPLLWVVFEPDENPDAFQGVLEVGADLQQNLTKNEYLFPLLPPGKARISLSYSQNKHPEEAGYGYREVIKRVSLVDGETATVNFDDETIRLLGTVKFQGQPCGEGSLHLMTARENTTEELNARTRRQGDFDLNVLAGGDTTIRAGAVTPDGQVRFKTLPDLQLPASGELRLDIDLTDGEIARPD